MTVAGAQLDTSSGTQPTVALSKGEAEFVAIVRGAACAIFVRTVLGEMGFSCRARVFSDSAAARGMAGRHGLNAKTKHLDIKLCWLQEKVRHKDLELLRVASAENPADILTKWVGAAALEGHLQRLGWRRVAVETSAAAGARQPRRDDRSGGGCSTLLTPGVVTASCLV